MDRPIVIADAWASILEGLRGAVTRQNFSIWFRGLRLRDASDGTATFAVPNLFVRDWIESYYADLLRRLVHEATGRDHAVRVVVDTALAPSAGRDGAGPPASPPDVPAARDGRPAAGPGGGSPGGATAGSTAGSTARPSPAQTSPGAAPGHGRHADRRAPALRRAVDGMRGQLFGHSRYPNFLSDVILNDEYVFDSFVQGPGNELALAAAQAVANAPGQAYNPLFIHGGVGLGKTHLLQAVCHRVLAAHPDSRILYLACETFVNQFISALEANQLDDFRHRYRHVDVLVIDDIHFLARKERTQEEFFHTFNTLYHSKKQIVLSSDSPPREIPTLEDRVVSRFKWGLVAEVEQPDHETRIRIVRRKAERRGAALPEGVAELIADAITTNVREIEGAVLKVMGYASLTKRPLTLALANEALRDTLEPRERKVSLETIMRAVCEHYGVKASDLTGKRRQKSVSLPRQVCMYLARRLTDLSLVEIGGHLGGRDHTTVIYANERIAAALETSPRLREDLDAIVRKIRAGG